MPTFCGLQFKDVVGVRNSFYSGNENVRGIFVDFAP